MRLQNQKGQTFIIVVVVMVIALTIGISISSRFISTLKSLSRSDSSTRAVGIAEASVERLLLKTTDELESYITNNNCGSNCYLEITSPEGLKAVSNVTLSYVGNSTSSYNLDLSTITSSEVNLKGYPTNTNLYVCWNTPLSGDKPSVSAIYVSGAVGSYVSTGYAYNSVSSSHTDNKFSTAAPNQGYANCFTVLSSANSALIRLKSHYNNVTVVVIPSGGASLPKQGVLISAIGSVGDEKKKVEVVKSTVALPPEFDYVLYQKTTSSSLSN